ncbi:uncharacterized protein [Dendropsophus ebraccatus]|uniref:uncharacterized protein n=1 Tax=Dendropsophus ebraccatus TaxID=150705 RepID=UPI0038313FC3
MTSQWNKKGSMTSHCYMTGSRMHWGYSAVGSWRVRMSLQRVLVMVSLFTLCFGKGEVTESSVIGDPGIGNNGGHISGGLIGGIIGLVLAFLVIISCIIYWCRRRRRQRPQEAHLEEVLVRKPDLPGEEKHVRDQKQETIPAAVLAVLEKRTEETVRRIEKMAKNLFIDVHRRLRDPVAIGLSEKKKEVARKKGFWRFGSLLKKRKEKSRTRSHLIRERRRDKIRKKQEKRRKICRRTSWLCCR